MPRKWRWAARGGLLVRSNIRRIRTNGFQNAERPVHGPDPGRLQRRDPAHQGAADIGFNAILDGLSGTLLVGEKAMDPDDYATGTWFWDEPYFLGGSGGTPRGHSEVLRDTRGVSFSQN